MRKYAVVCEYIIGTVDEWNVYVIKLVEAEDIDMAKNKVEDEIETSTTFKVTHNEGKDKVFMRIHDSEDEECGTMVRVLATVPYDTLKELSCVVNEVWKKNQLI